jgi:transposase/CheY-like chemotaxis protein
VRFIDAFVSSLNLGELGFVRAEPAATGRPGYEPGDLLRLYIYGYLNRVRSSRRLEVETQRNVEVMWLLGKLTPDFKTIVDFRAHNAQAITAVCKQFVGLCRHWDLFGAELVAVDGSKFRASNSRNRIFTVKGLRKRLERAEEMIGAYLAELDENDRCEESAPTSRRLSEAELQEKISKLKQRQQRYQELQKKLEQEQATQVALTDPDARLMHQSSAQGGGSVVAYNVQSVVDAKHKLIVAHDVTTGSSDQQQLTRMAITAKQVLGIERLEVVADQGYYDGDEVAACEQAGIEAYVPKPQTSKNLKRGLFTKRDFAYDAQADRYRCPNNQWLEYRGIQTDDGRRVKYYLTEACAACELRSRCTEAKGPRHIKRLVNEEALERMAARVAAQPHKLEQRKALVEHPFGTLKRGWNHGHCLLRTLPKVAAEFSLSVLTYNLRRVLNILGPERMIAGLAES